MFLPSILNGRNAITVLVAGTVGTVAPISVDMWTANSEQIRIDTAISTEVQTNVSNLQRQISDLKNTTNQETRNSRAIEDIKKQLAELGNGQNGATIAVLSLKLDALQEQLDGMTFSAGGTIDPAVIENTVLQMEGRVAARLQNTISASVTTQIETIVEQQLASLPISSENNIPIATQRQIFYVEKDCVYLPSFGRQFTLKFKNGTEFCMEPSLLYMQIDRVLNNGYTEWFVIGGRSAGCSFGDICFIGNEEDGTRYRIKLENEYEEEGIQFVEWNFEKMG